MVNASIIDNSSAYEPSEQSNEDFEMAYKDSLETDITETDIADMELSMNNESKIQINQTKWNKETKGGMGMSF